MLEERFDDFFAELMQNPKFKSEYDALQPEFDAIRAEMGKRADEQREPTSACRPAVSRRTVSAAQ